MNNDDLRTRWVRCALAVTVWIGVACQSHAQSAALFTAEQAKKGKATYEENCSRCHGSALEGGQFGPPLISPEFIDRWADQPLGAFFTFVKTAMPPGAGGTLSNLGYADVIAHILASYGLQSGAQEFPAELGKLEGLHVPKRAVLEPAAKGRHGAQLAAGVVLPPWPARPDLLSHLASITDEQLSAPPEGSWLSWRRTRDAAGFSPLKQVTRKNVQNLQVAWSLALPPGPNETTPLMHDGVLFVQSYGDHVQALDASTGDELWHYSRRLPQGASATVHRNMALYGDKLYVTTSDVCVIALDIKTGKVVWEQRIGDFKKTLSTGGPLIAAGVVMQGLTFGGHAIVGLNAETGKIIWRFNTIAQPGEPHGDSWNGLPAESRSGGSVWTAGSYDPEQKLAFFGTGPTYDTEPLKNPVNRPGITNDALYTDVTLAIDPQTGRLAWHYQHMANDQWDFDWAFERHLAFLPVKGTRKKLLLTAGKEAIYDALDAQTGQYIFSMDLGLQNVVTSIDPKTGRKSIDRSLTPGRDRTVTACPHEGGGKSWLPASYDAAVTTLYVPLNETCMDMVPVPPGIQGFLSTGVNLTLRPRSDSDGRYGRVQAINLTTRKVMWVTRERAPTTTGVLATAGGVVFAGAADRWFSAYDASTGKRLWRNRVSDIPNSVPISYLANGEQYIAMVVGGGWGQAGKYNGLIPESPLPLVRSSAIWVFKLAK